MKKASIPASKPFRLAPGEIITFDELHRRLCTRALERSDTVKAAADLLGIHQRTLYRFMRRFDLSPPNPGLGVPRHKNPHARVKTKT